MRPTFPTFVLFALFVLTVRADPVDDYIQGEMKKQRINGLSLAVVENGKITKTAGYGLANVELNVPVSPESVFKIGSISKQFIAAGIMLLVQEGKLDLADSVKKYFPDAPATWDSITIRHLLTHTSGLVREAPGFDPLKVQNDEAVIRTAYPLPLHFAPGEKWEYCNVGYFALAEIIHHLTGQSWGDFLAERIFRPLAMNDTRTTTMTAVVPRRANGYLWKNGELQNAAIYFALRPSGAFLSTVLDLAKWDAALETGQILKPELREQMWAPAVKTPLKTRDGAPLFYGFGWEVDPAPGHRIVLHGGTLPGFQSAWVRFIDDKLSVIVLTNWDNARPAPIAFGIAAIYLKAHK